MLLHHTLQYGQERHARGPFLPPPVISEAVGSKGAVDAWIRQEFLAVRSRERPVRPQRRGQHNDPKAPSVSSCHDLPFPGWEREPLPNTRLKMSSTCRQWYSGLKQAAISLFLRCRAMNGSLLTSSCKP